MTAPIDFSPAPLDNQCRECFRRHAKMVGEVPAQ